MNLGQRAQRYEISSLDGDAERAQLVEIVPGGRREPHHHVEPAFAVPEVGDRTTTHRGLEDALKVPQTNPVPGQRLAVGGDLDLGNLSTLDDSQVGDAGSP